MSDPIGEELRRLAAWARGAARERHGAAALRRVDGFLAVVAGDAAPPDPGPGRELHRRLYFPGLTARPIWDAGEFALTHRLLARFPALRDEAARLLASGDAFASAQGAVRRGPSAALRGEWRTYYLQRDFRRLTGGFGDAPVALRALDAAPLSREAMYAFLGPGGAIAEHSDRVNFVLTLYVPLIAQPGSWIRFADRVECWVPGHCFVADSSFRHESTNASAAWRGVLIVDLWHPELTAAELDVLADVVPRVDAVLRSAAAA